MTKSITEDKIEYLKSKQFHLFTQVRDTLLPKLMSGELRVK